MVTLDELRVTYDVLAELVESGSAESGSPSWYVLVAARSVVAAEIHRAKDKARRQPDWRLAQSAT
jgi:sugar-specific transcriptional regulator TrmB